MFKRGNSLVLHVKQYKTFVEEHVSSENVANIPTVHWSMVMMKQLAMYHQQTNQFQQTNEQTQVIQEVVSLEVSKLNHTVINKKRDQMQLCFSENDVNVFFQKKYQDCVIKWGNRFTNNRFYLKMFIMQRNGEKALELR